MSNTTQIVGMVLMIAYLTPLLVGCVAGDEVSSSPPVQFNSNIIANAVSPLAGHLEDAIPITAPAVIDTPGHYLLTNNLTNSSVETAIWIQSSDVLLDGGGNLLEGMLGLNTTADPNMTVNLNTSGVQAYNLSAPLQNVTVTNLSVSGWGSGIWMNGVENATLSDIEPTGNLEGFVIADSANVTVRNCTVTDNIPMEEEEVYFGGSGITVTDSNATQILDSDISYNGWGDKLPEVGGFGILSMNNTALLLSGCNVSDNANAGLWDEDGMDTEVLGNQMNNNGGNGGIFMASMVEDKLVNATVMDNSVSGSGWGIWLIGKEYFVSNNTVSMCGSGILLDMSQNATLSDNVMFDNEMNFNVYGEKYENLLHQINTSNTVDDKPIYYLVNESGAVVDSATGAGVVYGVSCPDIVVQDLSFMNNLVGVFLIDSDGASVANVTAEQNAYGVVIVQCEDVSVETSAAMENPMAGFMIEDSDGVQITSSDAVMNQGPMEMGIGVSAMNCTNVSLQEVDASNNSFAGIDVEESSMVNITDVMADDNGAAGFILGGDTIAVTGCHIRRNLDVGIGMYDTTNATIWNNYVLNERNVDFSGGNVTDSFWNVTVSPGPNIVDGPSIGGNYWADPNGTGWSQITPDRGDGFCDAALVVDENNADYLPLVDYSEPEVMANFTASPLTGEAPLNVQFNDTSTGNITEWNWSFGDGQSSDMQNPPHLYDMPGNYSVSLNVTGPDGSDELTIEDMISVTEPAGDMGENASETEENASEVDENATNVDENVSDVDENASGSL